MSETDAEQPAPEAHEPSEISLRRTALPGAAQAAATEGPAPGSFHNWTAGRAHRETQGRQLRVRQLACRAVDA